MTPSLRFLLATTTVLAGLCSAAASAQTTQNKVGGTATITGAYSSNPFSGEDGSVSSPLVTLDLAPTFQHLTQRSTLAVSLDASLQQYVRRYGRNDSYTGSVDYQLRPAERISAHLQLNLSSAVLGAFNSYLPPVVTAAPLTGGETATPVIVAPLIVAPTPLASSPLLTDIGLYGLRNRRRDGRLAGDVSIGVTSSDTLTLSGYGEATRYGGNSIYLGNYEVYSSTLGYQRRVSAYINLGLQGTVSLYDYRNSASTHVYALEATASGRLSPIWTLNGSLGLSFVNGGPPGSTSSTSPSGSINLCRQGERSTMCVQAARQVSPTGIQGTQYATTAGLNWSLRLNERSSTSLGASYSQTGTGGVLLIPGGLPLQTGTGGALLAPGVLPLQTQYGQATIGYNRQLRRRLSFVASANARRLFGGDIGGNAGGSRPIDLGGQAGLSLSFGDLR